MHPQNDSPRLSNTLDTVEQPKLAVLELANSNRHGIRATAGATYVGNALGTSLFFQNDNEPRVSAGLPFGIGGASRSRGLP
jgi:hypothetical protein